MVDVDAPSENRAALAARGCDEPGLAAVAGVVVTGAGAAVTGAAAVKGATAVTGVVAGAAVAGAAAVAGERCLVAMFAPRPLLTASVKPQFVRFKLLRRRFAARGGQRVLASAAGALRPALIVWPRRSRREHGANLTAVTKLLARS